MKTSLLYSQFEDTYFALLDVGNTLIKFFSMLCFFWCVLKTASKVSHVTFVAFSY